MNHNDNAGRWNGRRDEDSIPAGCLDCIEHVATLAWFESLRRQPMRLVDATRNRARLAREIRGGT